MRNYLFAIPILFLLLTVPTVADEPDLTQSTVEMPAGPLPRYLMVVPDASGPPLGEARIQGGSVYSAVITLTLIQTPGGPIENYPAEDLWLEADCATLGYCGLPHPDASTDANGQAEFTGPYALGGHMPPGCLMQVIIGGSELPVPGVELQLMSPDINGDLEINLADITVFTQAIGEYDWVADYNADGVVNLSDIAFFAQAIGVGCAP